MPKTAWKRLKRPARYEVKTRTRKRPENVKERIVEEREFENKRLVAEYVAEFAYRPTKCSKEYRMVVVKKHLEVTRGQAKLLDDSVCFFYISNSAGKTSEQIVFKANGRCNQENLIEQHKNDVLLVATIGSVMVLKLEDPRPTGQKLLSQRLAMSSECCKSPTARIMAVETPCRVERQRPLHLAQSKR